MKIRGTALAPGVSRNGRYYSPAMIRQAVEQAQPRVASGRMLMKAFHDASDTLGVVGRVESLSVAEDGSAVFTGQLADTSTARDVGALIGGKKPFVDGVFIVGRWLGKVQTVNVGGVTAETSPAGLQIDGVDFTSSPGIDRARVVAESMLSGKRSRVIFESAGPVVPVPAERSERDYAAMTTEEFDQAAGEVWTGFFAAGDQRRQAQGASPFWRGMQAS